MRLIDKLNLLQTLSYMVMNGSENQFKIDIQNKIIELLNTIDINEKNDKDA